MLSQEFGYVVYHDLFPALAAARLTASFRIAGVRELSASGRYAMTGPCRNRNSYHLQPGTPQQRGFRVSSRRKPRLFASAGIRLRGRSNSVGTPFTCGGLAAGAECCPLPLPVQSHGFEIQHYAM